MPGAQSSPRCRSRHVIRRLHALLAAAVRDNLRLETLGFDGGGPGGVIGTEHEPEKAKIARRHFAEAGLADLIDFREGDLRRHAERCGRAGGLHCSSTSGHRWLNRR